MARFVQLVYYAITYVRIVFQTALYYNQIYRESVETAYLSSIHSLNNIIVHLRFEEFRLWDSEVLGHDSHEWQAIVIAMQVLATISEYSTGSK